jgi:hypothetical protein
MFAVREYLKINVLSKRLEKKGVESCGYSSCLRNMNMGPLPSLLLECLSTECLSRLLS